MESQHSPQPKPSGSEDEAVPISVEELPPNAVPDAVCPLIFDRLRIPYSALRLRTPLSLSIKQPIRLRGFDIPGKAVTDVASIAADAEGLTFSKYGVYGVTGPFGAVKVLLIHPDTDLDGKIIAVSRFVAACVYHSGVDTHLSRREGRGAILRYPAPLLKKLFYSDQPLGLWCGDIADVLAFILHGLGFSVRMVSTKNHIFIEAFFPALKRWIMVDPDLGVLLRHRGRLISTDTVASLRSADRHREIELDFLSKPVGCRDEFNFPPGFTGQFTWRPDCLFDYNVKAKEEYYRRAVIEDGFSEVNYHQYFFTQRVETTLHDTMQNSMPVLLSTFAEKQSDAL